VVEVFLPFSERSWGLHLHRIQPLRGLYVSEEYLAIFWNYFGFFRKFFGPWVGPSRRKTRFFANDAPVTRSCQ
jgi:hypothetical protein